MDTATQNTILSASGNKEARFTYNDFNGHCAFVDQISFNGVETERDYFASKRGFKTREAAEKWAIKTMNA